MPPLRRRYVLTLRRDAPRLLRIDDPLHDEKSTPRHVETSTLVAGLEAAVERVRSADLSANEGFHALFEALAWVGAVRDRLWPKGVGAPATVNGLYYVRNLVIHRGADAVAILTGYGRGAFGSGTFGGDAHAFPPRSELPPPRFKWGADDYDAHVDGKDVYLTLQRAVDETVAAAG